MLSKQDNLKWFISIRQKPKNANKRLKTTKIRKRKKKGSVEEEGPRAHAVNDAASGP